MAHCESAHQFVRKLNQKKNLLFQVLEVAHCHIHLFVPYGPVAIYTHSIFMKCDAIRPEKNLYIMDWGTVLRSITEMCAPLDSPMT